MGRYMVVRVWYVDADTPAGAVSEARPGQHIHVQTNEYRKPRFYDVDGLGCFVIVVPDGSPNRGGPEDRAEH